MAVSCMIFLQFTTDVVLTLLCVSLHRPQHPHLLDPPCCLCIPVSPLFHSELVFETQNCMPTNPMPVSSLNIVFIRITTTSYQVQVIEKYQPSLISFPASMLLSQLRDSVNPFTMRVCMPKLHDDQISESGFLKKKFSENISSILFSACSCIR